MAGPRYLFLIRGKFGDTLVAYSVFRAWLDRHPGVDATLVVRRNYAELLAGESGFRLVPYRNRLQVSAAVLTGRVLQGWDAFAVLLGFGGVVPALARLSGARRRLYLDGRFRADLPEFPPDEPHQRQVDAAWRVAKLLDPDLPRPERLAIPSLAERRRRAGGSAIGVTPLSDEVRRNMSPEGLAGLLHTLAARHPGAPIHVFLNPGEEAIMPADAPPQARPVVFRTLVELVDAYVGLAAWYGTDTGLYHLAAAMDIPCTVFYGPTQPHKNSMPGQDTLGLRLEAMGKEHCEEKACPYAACLDGVVAAFGGDTAPADLARVPAGCPLRAAADAPKAVYRHVNAGVRGR